jgi:hypothetical protein
LDYVYEKARKYRRRAQNSEHPPLVADLLAAANQLEIMAARAEQSSSPLLGARQSRAVNGRFRS